MTRGRKRKFDSTIPAHIDQAAIPRGIYWDRSGKGRWFVLDELEGRPKRKTVATRNARTSELHAIAEERAGVDRTSLGWLLEQFSESDRFKNLSPRTQKDYEYQRLKIAPRVLTKAGKLSELRVARLAGPFMQVVFDKIAKEHPTKANHLMRYLRRVFKWGMARGKCTANPCAGLESAKERKRRVVPMNVTRAALVAFAQKRGDRKAYTEGSCSPYLWSVMEIGYMCRLRPIETITLTDAHALDEGVMTNRTKGSRDNVTRWSPRLRAAWDAAIAIREETWARRSLPIPMRAEDRPLFVSTSGMRLRYDTLSSAWQRMVAAAIADGVITKEQRFGLHSLKHRGISDTPGTRGEKQLASGHKTEAMLDVYDRSVPSVDPASAG